MNTLPKLYTKIDAHDHENVTYTEEKTVKSDQYEVFFPTEWVHRADSPAKKPGLKPGRQAGATERSTWGP